MIGIIGYVIYAKFFWEPTAHQFNEMAEIPAGSYIYQDTQASLNHTFYIDKYEVTWGEYLRFLKAVQKAGTDAAWRSPDQVGEKDHNPKDWAETEESDGTKGPGIYRRIRDRQYYKNQILTLDDPVFNVDWYDAYAYAKWAGKRLPSEEEWEKAARGPNGNLYPWGNDLLPYGNNRAPIPGTTYTGQPTMKVVNDMGEDKSYYGVYGMAGNVSEWTGTMTAGNIIATVKVPVIRGANFATNSQQNVVLTHRTTRYPPETRQYWLGFRCASDTPPAAPAAP